MFERFNDEARRAAVLAQEEARQLGHDTITQGHLLLALTNDWSNGAGDILQLHNIAYDDVLQAVTARYPITADSEVGTRISFRADSQRVFVLGVRISQLYGRNGDVNATHLLLGLLKANDTAALILRDDCGVDLKHLQSDLEQVLDFPKLKAQAEERRKVVEATISDANTNRDDLAHALRRITLSDRQIAELAEHLLPG